MTFSVDVLFQILNFLVVCIGVVYIVKRYGILYIVSSMRLKRHKQEELHRQYENLLQQCDSIKLQVQEIEHSYVSMQEKFDVWQTKVQQEHMKERATLLGCEQKLQAKQLIKLQSLQQQQIIEQQLPKILQDVSDNLQATFEKKSALQQEYTAQLLKFISEREL